eukprot:1583651-Rhodomonas_salina.2
MYVHISSVRGEQELEDKLARSEARAEEFEYKAGRAIKTIHILKDGIQVCGIDLGYGATRIFSRRSGVIRAPSPKCSAALVHNAPLRIKCKNTTVPVHCVPAQALFVFDFAVSPPSETL